MSKRILTISALFVAAAWLASAAPSFTLEQVLSAPFPSDLVAAPAGGKIAWVLNARGARNIWIAAPPDYKGRQLTAYPADDGQEISDLVWTPDAGAIVFVRGGDFEHPNSEYPNPRSSPEGVEQTVWVIPAAGGEPRRISEGRAPAVSPQGARLVFVRKGQVWSAPLDGSEKPAQLIHARGDASGLRWSPDGTRLAFESIRRDHAFIGVYNVAAKSLAYADASVDRDSSPVWSPNGKQVAFVRIPATGPMLFGPRRSGEPWSIRVADASTGAGRQVWKAEPGAGSAFRNIVASNQLFWGAGDRIIFPWERDGWTHLYSIPVAAGGAAALLTPGRFEVEHVALSPDRREIVFSSNQGDVNRRHLWKVSVSGGDPTALTAGSGIEWAPVLAGDNRTLAFFRSDARHPGGAAIQTGSGPARDLAPQAVPAEFPEAALVEPQPVVISAADGLPIHAQLFVPPGLRAGERRPAVVFFHGGSRRQMLLGWHYMYYYSNAYGMNQYLASRGYVVLSVNYRSGIGYGMEFREAINYGARGASEFNDVQGAGLYLRSRPDVDPKRIGLWGGSYGGYLTALGLARASDLFAAGVDLHGVHDWRALAASRNPGADSQAQEAARVAFESSPMASVRTWRSPVLLIHGDDDRNVPFSETVTLVEALRRQSVELEQLIFPDEIHDFLTQSRWLEAYHAAADFFDRHLGAAR